MSILNLQTKEYMKQTIYQQMKEAMAMPAVRVRRIVVAVALLTAMAGMSSCTSFLEVDEKGKATIPSFLSDPDGLNAGLVGAYYETFTYYDNEFGKYADVAGDMLQLNTTVSDMLDIYNYTSDASNETSSSSYMWRRIYVALANTNNVLEYGPRVLSGYPARKSQVERTMGEAYFLRALCHFDLCRVFAQTYAYTSDASHLGVPVLTVTPSPDDNVSRRSVAEVYEQILSDLTEAERLLADKQQRGEKYVSLQSVYALRSRVCLYKEDWDEALRYARKAMGEDGVPAAGIVSGSLAQGSDYTAMFENLGTAGEMIFRLSGENNKGKMKTFYESSGVPSDTLVSLFDEGDIRLSLLYKDGVAGTSSTKQCRKYSATTSPDGKADRDDPVVIRLSEVYLNAAEAACMKGEYAAAKGYLLPLLARAVGEASARAVINATADGQLLALIKRERTKELCCENHRLFDQTRWKDDLVRPANSSSSLKRLSYPNDRFVQPIPLAELNANTNMQPNSTVNN